MVGPVCESGDFLALDRDLAAPEPGDLLAVMTAGAYGAVQAGTYNTRPLVPEVMVKGDRFGVVRPRMEVAELIARDRLPDWLAAKRLEMHAYRSCTFRRAACEPGRHRHSRLSMAQDLCAGAASNRFVFTAFCVKML